MPRQIMLKILWRGVSFGLDFCQIFNIKANSDSNIANKLPFSFKVHLWLNIFVINSFGYFIKLYGFYTLMPELFT